MCAPADNQLAVVVLVVVETLLGGWAIHGNETEEYKPINTITPTKMPHRTYLERVAPVNPLNPTRTITKPREPIRT